MEAPFPAAADIIASSSLSDGFSAPYGRACANCSRAKCRCVYRKNGAGCERCYRLSKECQPSITVRRNAGVSSPASKRSSSLTLSRAAQLELKLDGLISLLKSQSTGQSTIIEGATSNTACSASTPSAASDVFNSYRAGITNSQASSSNGHAASTISKSRQPCSYTAPESRLSHKNQSLYPNGPDFGCGIVPHNNGQSMLSVADLSTPSQPRTNNRASTSPLDGVMPHGEQQTCIAMAGKCAGGHMPRTPESSNSSTATATATATAQAGHNYQQGKRQLLEGREQEQQGQSAASSANLGWGFGNFAELPRPRDIQAPAISSLEPDGSVNVLDFLNLDPALEPTLAEADLSLDRFRTTMLPYFPFVNLPPDLTAAQLRRNRPALWLSIMSVTCQRVPTHTQLARNTHLRALFAHRIVFESEKSLDLLQALLAFLTWVHYTSKRDRPTLCVLSQLAVSLVYDLGLHKGASPCKSLIARLLRDHYQQSLTVDDQPTLPPLLDERRAALATYMLTSKFSIALKRCEPLRWTTRLEEHLHEIAVQAETPLDHVLVTQVRLQRLADHVHQGEWQLNDSNDPNSLRSNSPELGRLSNPENKLLPPYVVRVLRAKLEEIRDNIPAEVRNYDGVLDALYAAEMMLCAGAVLPVVAPVASMASIAIISVRARSKPPLRSEKPVANIEKKSSASGGFIPSAVDYSRVAALEQCVEAVAQFWSFFQKITSGSYAALPFAFFAHFTHCVVLLYGLSVVDEPNWDRASVRDRLHVLDMLDGFIAKLRDAPRVGPGTSVTGTEA
ncbi:hypothetical protein SEPCBS57363_001458 [Sporothrix epigloea]|uniref:Zn(2)-C6 fungal-type domain-containing protein n=1 Tax=Sporothrix epigloea TaxID=1892477 RepID=A0ABP0DBY5_9PEZI